ncbi:MAG: AmmeMemoRadiSam system protein B [Methanosphaera sp.]|nr:AmmeMemoRadiSam system protein B [Methanosphaera sp.]
MIRKPGVFGLFYPSDEDVLEETISDMFSKVSIDFDTSNIVSGVVPHAGYIYSGLSASYTFKSMSMNELPDTIIIIGPNHTGLGSRDIALSDHTIWSSPLGDTNVDVELRDKIISIDRYAYIDNDAHLKEHSIEVEIPFIQYISKLQDKSVDVVPIVMSNQSVDVALSLANSIYEASLQLNRKCIVLASTDLTHYESVSDAKVKDTKVLNDIESMDIKQLINDIITYNITMCGYGPTITAICYAKLLNANNSIILNYSNSGEYRKDYGSVVGYGSAIIKQ